MTEDDVRWAKRLVLLPVLAYVLWILGGNLFGFAAMLAHQRHEQQQTMRELQQKSERETALLRQNREMVTQHYVSQPNQGRQAAIRSAASSTRPKLTAASLVNRLRALNAFGLAANPRRGLHCVENGGDWDYTCLLHPDPIAAAKWVQFGVLVDDAHVIEMSKPVPSETRLPPPLSPDAPVKPR